MQWCRANAFLCCLSATTIQKRVSLSGQQPIRLVHLFVTQWLWVFLLGPAPFAFCFSAGWRSAYLAGGSAFRPLRFVFVVFCAFDLPTYMTTGVHVDVILTCFFSCKYRASKRYRPHQRKKKVLVSMKLCSLWRRKGN